MQRFTPQAVSFINHVTPVILEEREPERTMSAESKPSTEPSLSLGLSQRAGWAHEQPISYLMAQAVENPGVLSLAAGLVDEQTLPVELCRDLVAELLGEERSARAALQYGTTPGSERLRRAVCTHLAELEGRTPASLPVAPERIVMTAGSQQLLSLVAETLLDPGDICFVAAPTYFVFLGVLDGVGARTVPIPADDDGMQVDLLEQQLQQIDARGELERVKLIYVVSEFENPSGCCLSAARRQQLLEIAHRWSRHQRIHILEDAAYRELRYAGDQRPSLWSLDPTGETVILAHTFSKSFSPGIRVGYGVLPPGLVGPVCHRKGNQDFGSAHFNQRLLALAMETGRYREHVQRVRDGYRTKLAVFLSALAKEFADLPDVHWVQPEGGLYVWMTLPDSIATGFNSRLFNVAVHEHQVMYVPGELCYPATATLPAAAEESMAAPVRKTSQMRLSFGMLDEAGLRRGAERLAAAVRSVMAE